MSEPVFDHEKLDDYRLAIAYAAWAYESAKELSGVTRHIRDQWLRASLSMLTRLIQRLAPAGEDSVEYEHKYERDDNP